MRILWNSGSIVVVRVVVGRDNDRSLHAPLCAGWLAGRGDSANVTVLARTIPPGRDTMISTEPVAAAFIIRVRVCSFALFPPRRWGSFFSVARARTRSRKHGVGCWLLVGSFLLSPRWRPSSAPSEGLKLDRRAARSWQCEWCVGLSPRLSLGGRLGPYWDPAHVCVVWGESAPGGGGGLGPGPESKRIKPAAALSSSHSSPVAFQQLTQQGKAALQTATREW